jgi:hypothetical protein
MQIVVVEPHAEFSKLGQELTSGMAGVTWRGAPRAAQNTARPDTKPPGVRANRQPAAAADYGELDLGNFSPAEVARVAREREAARAAAAQTHNPYALGQEPPSAAPQEPTPHSSWDIAEQEARASSASAAAAAAAEMGAGRVEGGGDGDVGFASSAGGVPQVRPHINEFTICQYVHLL